MKRTTLPALTLTALLLPACSQLLMAAAPPVTRDPLKAPAGDYRIDPNHTQVLFTVNHMGFTEYSGSFSGVSGTLSYAPRSAAANAVSVSVPIASVATTSPKLTEELKQADWLDAARYPSMDFRSSTVTQTGPTTADIAGTLTLHGVSHPFTLHATFIGAGVNILDRAETIGFRLSGDLERSDYGVSKYVPLIGDTVTITINAAFEKH